MMEMYNLNLEEIAQVIMANNSKPTPCCYIKDKEEYGSLGKVVDIEHLKAYVVKPDAPTNQAVIVIQDVYGWQTPNIRYITDMISGAGYIAVCPDFFVGKDPWDPSGGELFQEWQKDKKSDTVLNEVNVVLNHLKQEFGAKRIGVVGFCWGGAAAHHIALQYPEIKAAVSFYGMARYNNDNYELKCPTLFIFAEKDSVILIDEVNPFKGKLKERCPEDFQVKIFPKQTHGFGHRKKEDIMQADQIHVYEARKSMIHWLKKYM